MNKREKKQNRKRKVANEYLMRDETVFHVYVKKGGGYYQPGSCGYTEFRERAGIFPKKKGIAETCCKGVTVVPINTEEHNSMIYKAIEELKRKLIL